MQIPTHNLQNKNKPCSSTELLKKIAQLTLSFSLFSFFFFHPSCFPFLVRIFESYFTTLPSQFLSLASDKNYIFLLCNGILVVIAKFSIRTTNKQPPLPFETENDNDMFFKGYSESLHESTERSGLVEDVAKEQDEENTVSEANEGIFEEEPEGRINEFLMIKDDTQREVEERIIYVDNYQDEDEGDKKMMEKGYGNGIYEEEEEEEVKEENNDEEEEEEEIAKMSTEELNRKFEEFIRKMKEDLRIEARQQQLIMV